MKKYITYTLAAITLVAAVSVSGCGRGSIRTRTHHHGDRSVTIVKRPHRSPIKGRKKAVTTTKYNRGVK